MDEPAAQSSAESVWKEHDPLVRDTIEQNFPAAVLAVDDETRKRVFAAVVSGVHEIFESVYPPPSRQVESGLASWFRYLAISMLRPGIAPFIYKNHISDEDLARLSLAGDSHAGECLAERYLPKITKVVARIVHTKHLCPFSDSDAFIEDVSSEVALKLTTKLHTYRFEQPLEHWVAAVCKKAAYSAGRKDAGRSEKGPRKYVSWEDFEDNIFTPVKPEHHAILEEIFGEHEKEGVRAVKSNKAIRLSHFWGLEAKEVAQRLRTTPGYVNQLISHDYPRLRRISIDKLGISGTDI